MDKNTKIALVVMGVVLAHTVIRTYQLYKWVSILDQIVDNMMEIQDKEFQAEVEERFVDIVEKYDQDFPDG